MPSKSIKMNEKLTVRLTPKAGTGPGSLVPGSSIPWSMSNPGIASMSVSADGLTGIFTPLGPGTSVVSSSGNSIPFGPSFTSTFDLTVEPLPADHFDYEFQVDPL